MFQRASLPQVAAVLQAASTQGSVLYRWGRYLAYAVYTILALLCEVIAGVLELPTDAPQYDALLHQASCAETYAEWLPVAATLDDMDGFQQWRTEEISPYFSFEGVMRAIEELLELRSTGDAADLLDGLLKRVNRSLCGISHHRLYIYRTGTKTVIHSYTSLACFLIGRAGEAALANRGLLLPRTREVLAEVYRVYGTTALVLEGGVYTAAAHLGVTRALFEAGLLPPVMYGGGSGALVAALVCCTVDLQQLFERLLTDDAEAFISTTTAAVAASATSSSSTAARAAARWWRLVCYGELVDLEALNLLLAGAVGDVTFAEAYACTGRVLNIPFTASAISSRLPHPQAKTDRQLLNHLTAPDVLVRSAVWCALAPLRPAISSPSSVLRPRLLLARTRQSGSIVVYDPSVVRRSYPNPCGEHAGSGATDPVQRMRGLFSIRYCITSDASVRGFLWQQLDRKSAADPLRQRSRFGAWLQYAAALWCLLLAQLAMCLLSWLGNGVVAGPSPLSAASVLQQDEGERMQIYPIAHVRTYLRACYHPMTANVAELVMEAQREVWPRLEQLRMSMSVEQVLAATLAGLPAEDHASG